MPQTAFNFVAIFLSLAYLIVPLALAGIHVRVKKRPVAQTFFVYMLVIGVGVQLLIASYSQLVHGKALAAYVGWPYSPFVREVGMANLSWGVLGVACIWIKGLWRVATAVGAGLFLFLAGIGHLVDAFQTQNFHLGNIGPVLWSDLLIPVLLMAFLWKSRGAKFTLQ